MRVAITGATGFVGSTLVSHLTDVAGCEVTAITRHAWQHPSKTVRSVAVGDLVDARWPDGVFADTDAVVHAAAISRWEPSSSMQRLFAVNAEAAAGVGARPSRAGVKRFVFLSSIKVNGEATAPGRPFSAHDAPAPEDPYGRSNWQAELGLRALVDEKGLDLVMIRPSRRTVPASAATSRSWCGGFSAAFPCP